MYKYILFKNSRRISREQLLNDCLITLTHPYDMSSNYKELFRLLGWYSH